MQRVEREHEIPIDNDKWAVSLLVQSMDDKTGKTGHAILAFMGKIHDQPPFWAADFNGNFAANDPISVIGAIVRVSYDARIRTTDYQNDRVELMNSLHGFSSWNYSAWRVTREDAQRVQQEINREKQSPPCYNLFGLDTLAHWRSTPTYNCSSWAVEKVRGCGIDIPGTLFYRLTGISAPGFEQIWNHQ